MKAKEPLSAYSALFYPIAGGWILGLDSGLTAWVAFLSLVLLGAGTFAYHYSRPAIAIGPYTINTGDLDTAGMNAAFLSLATASVGAPWWGVAGNAIAGVAAEYIGDLPNHALMGGLVLITVAAAGYSPLALAGLACMALGFAVWHIPGDIPHAIWHLFTATGTLFLYLA